MNHLRFKLIKHLKMTIWISVLWKINTHMARKWQGMVLLKSFIKEHSFRNSLYLRILEVRSLWITPPREALIYLSVGTDFPNVGTRFEIPVGLWHYGLWSYNLRDTKLIRLLPGFSKNELFQRILWYFVKWNDRELKK